MQRMTSRTSQTSGWRLARQRLGSAATSSSVLAGRAQPHHQLMMKSSTRGVHLHPFRHRHHNHETFLEAFARDPFFRPLWEEVSSAAKVGRPAVPKEGPRPRPLQTNVNVLETNQGFAIEAEMPGIRREDIRVEVREGDQLVIRGEKRFEKADNVNGTNDAKTATTTSGELKEAKEVAREEGGEAPTHRYLTFERSYGTFERTFALPESVDASKIKASYTDGVLKVEIPKAAKETPKSWSVEIH